MAYEAPTIRVLGPVAELTQGWARILHHHHEHDWHPKGSVTED